MPYNILPMIIRTITYAATQSVMNAFLNEPLRDLRYKKRKMPKGGGKNNTLKNVIVSDSMPWDNSLNKKEYLYQREKKNYLKEKIKEITE
ncbi:hypothetical protein ACFC9N_11380 [Enterococcus casseliflavus]|uniref:hypothetical protein n=1 Tax=Enterococcus TaxID=1350 RepID=UPI000A3D5E10|nr:hypothetical protein [Enterococcus sp. 4E1_DIV0656]OTO09287.1 hypothetical protein A5882_003620 [Enterococcus sp. 4E1_DIV0656]